MAEMAQPPAEPPAAKRKRADKNKGEFGWCKGRTSPCCRMADEDRQLDHRPNWKKHNLKWHTPKEEQRQQKHFMRDDDIRYIPHCSRCGEGFWTIGDLDEHCKVRRMQHMVCH